MIQFGAFALIVSGLAFLYIGWGFSVMYRKPRDRPMVSDIRLPIASGVALGSGIAAVVLGSAVLMVR